MPFDYLLSMVKGDGGSEGGGGGEGGGAQVQSQGRAVLIISAGLLVQVALVKEEGNNMRNS